MLEDEDMLEYRYTSQFAHNSLLRPCLNCENARIAKYTKSLDSQAKNPTKLFRDIEKFNFSKVFSIIWKILGKNY